MASKVYQDLDLASVLKTLASLAPASQYPDNQSISSTLPLATHGRDHTVQSAYSGPNNVQQLGSDPSPPPAPKRVDPTTITDWSTGLRCVMKTIATNDSIVREIQRVCTAVPYFRFHSNQDQMIKTQHEHEDQWWAGRQALLQKQEARKEGQKKLDDVLSVFNI
jgi:hypothetical protein